MTGYLRRLLHTPATRPALTVYLVSVAVAWAVSANLVDFAVGLILLGVATALVIMSSLHREVLAVHVLVNSQHDALVARVDQLLEALDDAGVQRPNEGDAQQADTPGSARG